MSITKKVARSIVFPTLMGLGFDKLIRTSSSNSCLNVMYHGVVQRDSNYFSPRHITSSQFEKQLKYLKKHFEIIRLTEAFDRINNEVTFKQKCVTISFDDGFRNNLTNALPLLEKHEILTTFFISSVCVEEGAPPFLWSELTAALNYFHKDEVITLNDFEFINGFDSKRNTTLNEVIKRSSFENRSQILNEMISRYRLDHRLGELPDEVWKLLSKDEVIQLSKSPIVDIGSHGHNHYNLGEIELDKARQELVQSKQLLENAIGKPVISIAFPDGSYTEEVKNIAEEVGYTQQMAVGYKTESDVVDRRIMNRHGIASTTTFDSNMLFLNLAFQKKGIRS